MAKIIGSAALTAPDPEGENLTTKGDLHGFSDENTRIPISTNNFSLLADSAQALGLKWAASSTSTLTQAGDLLVASGANTLSRLARGADNYILKMSGTSLNWEAEGGVSLSDANTWTANQTVDAFITSTPTELTISSGVVTATRSAHRIDSEGEASTDTLTHMNGYSHGRIVVLTSQDSTRDITLDDEAGGAGTLNMAGGDFTLSSVDDTIMFVGRLKDGVTFQEISRSNNS